MKKPKLSSILITALFILGFFSVARVLSEIMHPAGDGGFPVLHTVSAVIWFVLIWLVSRLRRRANAPEIPPSELASALQKTIGLPYKLLPDQVPPDTLLRFFKRTLKEAGEQGFSPILVPADPIMKERLEAKRRNDGAEPKDGALSVPEDGKAILERRWNTVLAQHPELNDPFDAADGSEVFQFESCRDGETGKPKETLLLRVPTEQPWQVAAFLPFGGWDALPDNGEILAVCKYWYETYRAVPAVFTYNAMEFLLPKTISREDAVKVAREHAAFCPGLLAQDDATGSIGKLADSLWKSNIWYFQWD